MRTFAAALARACALTVAVVFVPDLVAQITWSRVEQLPVDYRPAMASDPLRQRVIVYSPWYGTWEWDGKAWANRWPAGKPPIQPDSRIAYDPVRRRTILFGRENGLPGTWEWDGRVWTKLAPAHSPAIRVQYAMATDYWRNRVVLHGGQAGPIFDDTWEWDGNDWQLMQPNTKPGVAFAHALGFCAAMPGEMLMFGGSNGIYRPNDLWAWNGVDWRLVNTPFARPPQMAEHAMSFDPWTGKMLVHGEGGQIKSVTWEWDGSTWREVVHPTMPRRTGHALAPDFAGQQILLRGGQLNQDTWGFRSGQWTKLADSASDVGYFQAAGMDEVRDQVIVMGFPTSAPNTYTMWSMRGDRFTRLSPATMPPARQAPLLVYHRGLDKLMHFGGSFGSFKFTDTWLWDGATWTEHVSATPPPAVYARPGAALVYDDKRDCIVGVFCTDLYTVKPLEIWEWKSATGWHKVASAAGPDGVSTFSLAYDPVRQRVVLWGGRNTQSLPLDDTWEWDGVRWQWMTPINRPPVAGFPALFHVEQLGGIVWVGGMHINTGRTLADVWLWDGINWKQLAYMPDWTSGWQMSGISTVYDGGRRTIRNAKEPLLTGAFPTLSVDQPLPRLGENVRFSLFEPSWAQGHWFTGLALQSWPGVPLLPQAYQAPLRLPLAPDALLGASLAAGIGGRLDAAGNGTAALTIPLDPALWSFEFHAAAVVADPLLTSLRTVSNAVKLTITR